MGYRVIRYVVRVSMHVLTRCLLASRFLTEAEDMLPDPRSLFLIAQAVDEGASEYREAVARDLLKLDMGEVANDNRDVSEDRRVSPITHTSLKGRRFVVHQTSRSCIIVDG